LLNVNPKTSRQKEQALSISKKNITMPIATSAAPEVSDHLLRYEAHLSRETDRTLNRLKHEQRRRLGHLCHQQCASRSDGRIMPEGSCRKGAFRSPHDGRTWPDAPLGLRDHQDYPMVIARGSEVCVVSQDVPMSETEAGLSSSAHMRMARPSASQRMPSRISSRLQQWGRGCSGRIVFTAEQMAIAAQRA